jgi:hypothetical protein
MSNSITINGFVFALFAQRKIDSKDLVMCDCIMNQAMTKAETARVLKISRQAVDKRLQKLKPFMQI